MSFADERRRMVAKFKVEHRYRNFGPALHSVEISGFRGIDSVKINFESPVTAICGLNGTGKSTIAQICTCAYRKLTTSALKRYYVKDFFPVSAADPEPFQEKARVIFNYTVDRGEDPQQVTVSRAVKEWGGYKRQPERACYYVGFTQFIPKIERRDFSIYNGHLAQLGDSRPMDDESARRVSNILGIPYESLSFTEVKHQRREAELATATLRGITYSENNMGFGEGRVVYMVRSMEEAPPQSLFILEEPETSLHGEAQVKLAEYLIDVCNRRGHQVILTTHSAAIIQRLPTESVVYLRRHPDTHTLEAFPGLPAYQIDAYLRGVDSRRDRVICVEDRFAKILLGEILRQHNQDLLVGSSIVPIGGKDDVPLAVKLLSEVGLKVVGITDADARHFDREQVMSLPGTEAPEKEVFANETVREYLARQYSIDVESAIRSCDDHHDYATKLASRAFVSEEVVVTESCRTFVSSLPYSHFETLVKFINSGF